MINSLLDNLLDDSIASLPPALRSDLEVCRGHAWLPQLPDVLQREMQGTDSETTSDRWVSKKQENGNLLFKVMYYCWLLIWPVHFPELLFLSVDRVRTDEELEVMLHRDSLRIFISDVGGIPLSSLHNKANSNTWLSLDFVGKQVVTVLFPFTDQLRQADLQRGSERDWISASGYRPPWVQHQRHAWDIYRHGHAAGNSGKTAASSGYADKHRHGSKIRLAAILLSFHQGDLINNIEKNVTSAAEYVDASTAETGKALTYKKNPYKIASLPDFFKPFRRQSSAKSAADQNPSNLEHDWAPEPVWTSTASKGWSASKPRPDGKIIIWFPV